MTPPLLLEQAQALLLRLAGALPVEQTDTATAIGRYLAAPLLAERTQPAADLSAMDGYAVCADDLAGPWQLVGESAAGHPWPGTVSPGHCVRVSTGALVPAGTATVIVQEDLTRSGERVTLTGSRAPQPGAHIRPQGSDFVHGSVLLPAGTAITAAAAALALAAGHRQLPIHRKPRIVVIDCGDELAADPTRCAPHQVPASNGAMVAAMLAGLPCTVTRIGPIADEPDALRAALEHAADVDLADADLIVTSGGASVGEHDIVRPVLNAWGAQLEFWRVAIKPGKPLLVARRARQLVLGLPGNPVSSYVTAYLFLLPMVRSMLGSTAPLPRPLTVPLGSSIARGGPRREFLRAVWDGKRVWPEPVQDSGGLAALARSNALIDWPAAAPAAAENSLVSIYLLQNGGIA